MQKGEQGMKVDISLRQREQPQDWIQKYGIHTYELSVNSGEKKKQLVMKGNRLVEVFTPSYQVLPNEIVIEEFDRIAGEIGAVPFKANWDHGWYEQHKEKPNVIMGQYGDSVACLYTLGRLQDTLVTKDDPVDIGIVGRNSIDGSAGFGVSIFTYRKICSNMMMHLASEKMMHVTDIAKLRNFAKETSQNPEVLASITRKHTKNLDKSSIKESIELVLQGAENVVNRYKDMVLEKITLEQAKKIARVMPTKICESLNWLGEDEKTNEIKILDENVSQWKAFNDITDCLTNGYNVQIKKGTELKHKYLSYNGVLSCMKQVDNIFMR